MANVTLTDLIAKIRKLTARPSTNQISDNTITDYVNQFYEFDFPQNLKLFDFRTTYTFITQPNVDTYQLSVADRNLYKSFEPPVYCSGYQLSFHENRDTFYRYYPDLSTTMTLTTATGIAGPYAGAVSSLPIIRGTVLVTAVGADGHTYTATDVPNTATPLIPQTGTFAGDVVAGGTINYVTGAISLTFTVLIPAGNLITVRYAFSQPAKPLSMLFYDNTFTLRPVPDQAYEIEMQAFLTPTAYATASPNATPFLNDYFQVIAFGAALKIFVDSAELENYQRLEPLYREQLLLCERKSLMQIKSVRAPTIYSDVSWDGRATNSQT